MKLSAHERTGLKLSYTEMTFVQGRLQAQESAATDDPLVGEIAAEIARQHKLQQGAISFSGKSRTFLLNADELHCLRNCLPNLSILQASSRSEDKALASLVRRLRIRLSEALTQLEAPHQQREAERRARLIAEYDASNR